MFVHILELLVWYEALEILKSIGGMAVDDKNLQIVKAGSGTGLPSISANLLLGKY